MAIFVSPDVRLDFTGDDNVVASINGPRASPSLAGWNCRALFPRRGPSVRVARDVGKSSRGGLRGSYPEPGLGWQLQPWCSAHAVVPEFMRADFVFPSTALRLYGSTAAISPMANAGGMPQILVLGPRRGPYRVRKGFLP